MKSAGAKTNEGDADLARRLRRELSYDADSGLFRRHKTGRILQGKQAGGYVSIRFNGRAHLGHRLAWLYAHSCWPAEQLDHINHDRADNRLANLRECTNQQNAQNMSRHRDNSGGHLGVSWMPKRGKWQAGIGVNGGRINLGYHDTKEAALNAYAEAKRKHHPFGASNV